MITLDRLDPVPDRLRRAALSIGNFDGVHRGHRRLLGQLRAMADRLGTRAVALTFDPHPVAVLRPEKAPVPLTGTARKLELIRGAGVDEVAVFEAGPWLLNLSAREFFDRVIRAQFDALGLVEGPTFGFGRDRLGTVGVLADWCVGSGLAFEVAEPTEQGGGIVSSTRIRAALLEGRAEEAAALLGRPHRLRGTVARGDGRGRTIGFPTANLAGVDTLVPADGVYAARAFIGDGRAAVPSAVHVGPNVTFGLGRRTVEAHLIDFDGDLYGRPAALDLIARLRPTIKFDGPDALVAQMRRDVERARAVLSEDRS